MILLDTNVVSELVRSDPNHDVLRWIDTLPRAELFTASLVHAEMLYGIALMPEGKRKATLKAVALSMFAKDFAGRILPCDTKAAPHYAAIVAARRRAGRAIGVIDALIAATALAHGADLATRDVNDFEGCGLRIINPWDARQ